MSLNLLISKIISTEGKQMYEFPETMSSISRLVIGDRSLRYGITRDKGRKYIVLLEPVELSGITIQVVGR